MINKINHVWLFFTDRCNLGCGYCFYKYRTQQQVITINTFKNILEYIRPVAPAEFVFSGGEPLMDAPILQEMITAIRQENLGRYISVQTNATLLDDALMGFFLRQGVNLEVGIDGDEATTQRNGPGIGDYYYADIVRGVNLAISSKGPFTATMTVHPSSAIKLLENLKYLAAMGLKSIEVHPAFLEIWDEGSSNIFLDQYRRACAWELKEGKHGLIGRGYSEPSPGAWDLLSVPSGKILANWLLLSFPEEVREHLYLMDFSTGSSGELLPQAKSYFQALEEHLNSHPNCSYRSISNFNASCAVKTPPGRRYEQRVMHYIDLCEQIEEIDHKIFGNIGMAAIRYESLLVEQALSREYAAEMEHTLKGMSGLNDIKPLVRDFEGTFARYIGVKNALAVNSGSDALKMALLAAGVGKGDEVIVPDLTYQAVALAVFYCGGKPVPVDALKDDLQMDPSALEAAITKKTKAVIAAHMFGRPCDIDRIRKICREKKMIFIEDVCQAESSRYKGQTLGSFGDMATFSFSYYKPLSSCGGGGGMVILKDKDQDRVRRWMDDWRNDDELLKLGQRFAPMSLMDLIALRVKFSHLKEIISSRNKIKTLYEQELSGMTPLTIFKDRAQTESVAQNFVVCCRERDKFFDFLAAQGIVSQKPYLPLHQMAVFKGTSKRKFPVSEWYSATALHLPLHSFMSEEKARNVVKYCRSFLSEHL